MARKKKSTPDNTKIPFLGNPDKAKQYAGAIPQHERAIIEGRYGLDNIVLYDVYGLFSAEDSFARAQHAQAAIKVLTEILDEHSPDTPSDAQEGAPDAPAASEGPDVQVYEDDGSEDDFSEDAW